MQRPAHYRRCHICGYVNVHEDHPVERCQECNKSLAPFYYFDDRFTAVPAENGLRPQTPHPSEYGPIQGLTAYWENF